MSPWSRRISLFAVALAAVVMASSPAWGMSGHGPHAIAPHAVARIPGAAAPVPGDLAVPGGAALLAGTEAAIAAHHIPKSAVLLPNLHAAPTVAGGVVQPGYVTAPAPMGLG
ncbi:MAG TPA: hypothetical protein VMH90_03000, partial [Thermoplasmata archaeon]|nr:hypothetical protein [Thermoplasmata archaeon]